MNKILLIAFTVLTHTSFAQTSVEPQPIERKGFVFGLGLGAGALSLENNKSNSTTLSLSVPNIKVGYMITKSFALLATFPGAIYSYKGNDRGFEAFTLSGQYWVTERYWVACGMGLTFDAPAFYTIKDPATAEFYTGFPALLVATGYEIYRKGKFVLDIQYRFFYGQSNLSDGSVRTGISNMLLLGVNWY
ncbi:MAG: hypothetical protein HOP30_20635 [Cyclobacteriaceae bacterium]|nr:hypothetical protein [Cyclobacteriaceae bacterium]